MTGVCVPDLTDNIFSLEFNYNGSLLGTLCKDNKMRLVDPRTPKTCIKIINQVFGNKKNSSKLFWIPNFNWIGACGVSKDYKRQIKIWDLNKINDDPIYCMNLDQSSASLYPHYDQDTGIVLRNVKKIMVHF